MAALARTPVLPEAAPVRALSAQLRRPRPRSATAGLRRDRTCWPSWALSANCDVQSPIRYVRSPSASRRFEPFTVHLVGLARRWMALLDGGRASRFGGYIVKR